MIRSILRKTSQLLSRRGFFLTNAAGTILLSRTRGWIEAASAGVPSDTLASGFRTPPDSAKPWAYWWWLNGNVTGEGITKDLEEMKRQGINGVLIFHGDGGQSPVGPRFLSPAWRELFRYALHEASRLEMGVSVNLCDGWNSGGPWITPELANKKLVYSESQVDGPRTVEQALPLPPVLDDYYRDVAVVAFRENATRPVTPAKAEASSNLTGYVGEWNFVPQDAVDGDPHTYWSSKEQSQPEWLTFEYHEPLAAAAIYLAPAPENGPRECELESSLDGKTFSPVCRFSLEKGEAKRVEFPEVRATQFRMSFPSSYGSSVRIAEAWLLRKGDEPCPAGGIKWWWFKSGNRSFWDYPRQGPAALAEEYQEKGAVDCRSSQVLDLTGHLDGNGQIRWNAPAGRWTILRFGYTLEGQRIRGESIGSRGGYEADLLSSAGIEVHFRNTAEPLLADAEAVGGKALKYLHIDSYELGADVRGQQPTWSLAFRDEFKTRRGYDLLPFLPALARRVVDSREATDRVLSDFRWTIGDLMAEKFWARFRQLAHQRGMQIHTETGYGTYPFPHIDGLRCAGYNDATMGEFWYGTDIMSQFNHWGNVIRTVASAAHIYGRSIIQAESFTSWMHWQEYPQALKPIGDEAFTNGLNRMVFHQYTHQPKLDMKPGWQYGAGTHFDRNVTWWEQARSFFQYVARCQYLLQQGRFVADVLHFYGEGVTKFVPSKEYLTPPVPLGFDFDAVNADVLLNGVSVRNGRLVLPNGTSYRVLSLPEDGAMSLAVQRKLRSLVGEGAIVVGPKQRKGPLSEVLLAEGLLPDFDYANPGGDVALTFTHRSIGDTDVYFVANRQERSESLECAFRIRGKRPEIWDPVSGETRAAVAFRQEGGRTALPLEFAPYGSMFVVFRTPIDPHAHGSDSRNFPVFSDPHELTGPWNVAFDPRWGGPANIEFEELIGWTKRPEEGIKFYSGTATYRKTFDLPAALQQPGLEIALDLGEVKNVAQVRLNGKDLGVAWTKPFRVIVTNAVKPAANALEIDVVNLWPNRLIGDAALPEEKRFGRTNVQYKKDDPLLESGLLGKVTLLISRNRSQLAKTFSSP
jgi:hypothetical protein